MNVYETAYENNQEFKEYVDKLCKARKISKEEALQQAIIKEIYDYYKPENSFK